MAYRLPVRSLSWFPLGTFGIKFDLLTADHRLDRLVNGDERLRRIIDVRRKRCGRFEQEALVLGVIESVAAAMAEIDPWMVIDKDNEAGMSGLDVLKFRANRLVRLPHARVEIDIRGVPA